MTVLLIIKRFDFGGAENHVCELANELSKKGHNVILAGGKGRQAKKLHPEIKYVPVELKDFLIPCHVLLLSYLIIKQNVDIIHAHQRLAILNACLAGFITRRKVISTVHGRARYDLRHGISRLLSGKFIFVSKKVLQIANQRYNFNGRSVFIPNGIKPMKPGNNNTKPYRICYISKINKSHLDFLKLIINNVLPPLKAKYPQLEFWIIGDGRKINELKKLCADMNLKISSNCCNVLGYKSSLVSYYQSASLVMGVGRVALEASALGVPVLSVNYRRMSGMLSKEKYEYVKYTNFIDTRSSPPCKDSIQMTIEKFFNHQSEWVQESKKLADKVQEELSLDLMIKRIISLYKDMVKKN